MSQIGRGRIDFLSDELTFVLLMAAISTPSSLPPCGLASPCNMLWLHANRMKHSSWKLRSNRNHPEFVIQPALMLDMIETAYWAISHSLQIFLTQLAICILSFFWSILFEKASGTIVLNWLSIILVRTGKFILIKRLTTSGSSKSGNVDQ